MLQMPVTPTYMKKSPATTPEQQQQAYSYNNKGNVLSFSFNVESLHFYI